MNPTNILYDIVLLSTKRYLFTLLLTPTVLPKEQLLPIPIVPTVDAIAVYRTSFGTSPRTKDTARGAAKKNSLCSVLLALRAFLGRG